MTPGERIRERRLELGITLREFARRVEVSAPYLTDLEAGRRHPGPEGLQRIAAGLGLASADLAALATPPGQRAGADAAPPAPHRRRGPAVREFPDRGGRLPYRLWYEEPEIESITA